LAAAAVIAVLARQGDDRTPLKLTLDAPRALAASPVPALRIGRPVRLRAARDLAYWAPVIRPVVARAAPSQSAPTVGRLTTRTPERTANLVLALGRKTDARGRIWTRVRLPVLPNNTIGWVPRGSLGGLAAVRTRLVVDLQGLTATLYRGGRQVFRAPVGVGRSQWPTPRGEFYVRSRLASYRSPFYGPIAFGTSARSAVLTDWPAGGFVGIHGTNQPELLPGRVSHGCIRLRNADIIRLARLLPIGTPLTIR
jgi:lipoprotein-anchoring transpeptidase ErfK/SrfK